MKIQDVPDCHHSDTNDTNDIDDCKSICCYDKDYTTNNFLLFSSTQNTFKKFKTIISFFDI